MPRNDDLARLHGQLALARAHDPARHAHEVAEVHEVEDPVGGLPHLVGPHVDLELRLAVAQGGERGLPVPALREDPPRDPHLGPERLELLERPLPVRARDLAQPVAALEAGRVHLDAQGAQGPRLLQPLGRLRRPAGDGGLPRRAARASPRRSSLSHPCHVADAPADRVQHPVHERRGVRLAEALRELDRLVEDDRRRRLLFRQRARRPPGAGSSGPPARSGRCASASPPRRSPRRARPRGTAPRRPGARPWRACAACPSAAARSPPSPAPWDRP